MAYRIEFAPRVYRQFVDLSRKAQARLGLRIEALAGNPRPQGVKKISGEENLYRIRWGDYRVVYQVREKDRIVLIAKIGHRREIYRR